MKPLRLEFCGINSFSEETVIDFEALTAGGLFGIFGDTGSGKSTILDCINFALYGDVARSKEKIDIINYRSDKAKVTFSFNIINNGVRKIYTVERTIKRDKNGTHKAFLYERDGDNEICIADKASTVEKKIVELLGVDADDFRKCIALPQGEFAKFVNSLPSERLKLMERLFNLSKYGDRLKYRLSEHQAGIEARFQNVSGKLYAYSDVSLEALKDAEETLKSEKTEYSSLSKSEKSVAAERERLKDLNLKRKELLKVISALDGLAEKSSSIEELRKELCVFESCREAVKLSDNIGIKLAEKDKFATEAANAVRNREALAVKISKIEKSIKDRAFDKTIPEKVALAAKYATCEGKAEKLESLLKELAAKRAEYKVKEKSVLALNEEYEALNASYTRLQQESGSGNSGNIEKLISVGFKGAVLKDEIVRNLDWLANLNGNIKIYRDDSPLYEYVSCEVENKIAEYTHRILDLRDFKPENADKLLKDFERSEKERETLQSKVAQQREKLIGVGSRLEIERNNLKILERDGLELKSRADELKTELENIFGRDCSDFTAVIAANEREIAELSDLKEKLSDELEKLRNKRTEFEIAVEKCGVLSSSAEAELNKCVQSLESLIESRSLGSIEQCRAIAQKFADFPSAEQAVKNYDEEKLSLTLKKRELEATNCIYQADDERLAEVEERHSALAEKLSEITGSIAVKENIVKDLKSKLSEKEIIEKELEVVCKDRELAARLKEITKNNKFLEYVANEYLIDISSASSSTLINLTNGRYFLTYKDNNFYVGDNFNCGSLRGVNTLSGGEIFLVSLSLALALSQTICSRSMKSIEFFFLDEGFGTLDSALVDTVMNALEKLKSSAFTIGVISHVEELKYRINYKITVNKATETHGSTVNVSC